MIPPPPAYNRKVWQFNKTNLSSISIAISQFPWYDRLTRIQNPSLQVAILNETILNIMSNFVPNRTIRIKPSEPEWLNRQIKNMLKKQNRINKKYKKHGFKEVDNVSLHLDRNECAEAIVVGWLSLLILHFFRPE